MATSKESQEQSQIQTHLHVLIACSATRHTILLLLLLLLLHHVIRVHAHCVHADHARVSLGVRIPDLCECLQSMSRLRHSTYGFGW